MRIYQLQTTKEFYNRVKGNYSIEEIMEAYAKHVATRFAAECVNEALGNKMEVSNALHERVEKMYNSIIWENQ